MVEHKLVERISAESIGLCVSGLADRINEDYRDKEILLLGILKGAFVFMADLARRISIPVQMDFVRLSSYGDQSETSGSVRITKDLELPVAGKHILVVEDIVDTGITLRWLLDYLGKLGPESLKVCALIDKTERRQAEVFVDYAGMSLDSGFLVGYGLDFSEEYRHLPAIYEIVFGDTCV